uniref:Serine peptidase inhibitor, Kunitz type 2 n=1 Tax=Apteryx owenii TaxID=8824 RepID=A0A8B9PFN8_APTOW
MPRWWFNATSGLCQSFVFGGCNANLNNFVTEQECQASCARSGGEKDSNEILLPSRKVDSQNADAANKPGHRAEQANDSFSYEEFCMVPQVTGPCRASFSRWYYSPADRTCKKFIYGGCRGNKNNYQKEEQCMHRCSREPGKNGPDFHSDLSTKSECHPAPNSSPVPLVLAPQGSPGLRATWWPVLGWGTWSRERSWGKALQCRELLALAGCCLQPRACFRPWGRALPLPCFPGPPRPPPGQSGLCNLALLSSPAIALAVLLAILAAILLGYMIDVSVKMCRKNPELTAGAAWSPLDDKEYLMSNAYTL